MGARKFHSVEEMPGPPPLPRLDPENLRGYGSLAPPQHHHTAIGLWHHHTGTTTRP